MSPLVLAALTAVASAAFIALAADNLVRGAASIARSFGLSPLLTGMFVVGGLTSAPELASSMAAAFGGRDEMALGNIVGASIANLGLILGCAAVLTPIVSTRGVVRRDAVFLVSAVAAGAFLMPAGTAMPFVGFVALTLFLLHAITAWRMESGAPAAKDDSPKENRAISVLRCVGGVAVLVPAADIFVDRAAFIAEAAGMSAAAAGLIVASLGTSAPEMAAMIAAVRRGEATIIIGNAIGSCLFNILAIGGTVLITAPVAIPDEMRFLDLPVLLAMSLAVWLFAYRGMVIRRIEGAVLVAGYAAFVLLQVTPGAKLTALAAVRSLLG